MVEERKGIHYKNNNALCFLDAEKIGGLEYLGGGVGVVPELNVDVLGEWRTIYEPTKSITLDEYGIPSGLWDRMKADQTKYDEEGEKRREAAVKSFESMKVTISEKGEKTWLPAGDSAKFGQQRLYYEAPKVEWLQGSPKYPRTVSQAAEFDPCDMFKNTYGQEREKTAVAESVNGEPFRWKGSGDPLGDMRKAVQEFEDACEQETGRWSSKEPNISNTPKYYGAEETGRRRLFIGQVDETLASDGLREMRAEIDTFGDGSRRWVTIPPELHESFRHVYGWMRCIDRDSKLWRQICAYNS